jgi:uncharacterized integral membrane protein
MALAKVRSVVSLIVVVVIVTFVYFSTQRTNIEIGFYGGENRFVLPAWSTILLGMGVGFVLGYLFRITRFFRKKVPKPPEK